MTRTELGQDVSKFSEPEMSPEQKTAHYAQIAAAALERTGVIEIVEVSANLVNQIHIMGRVKQEHERKVAHEIVNRVLLRAEQNPETLECFLGKQFLRKNGKLCYAWVFSYGSKNIVEATHLFCDSVTEVSPKREVLEAPLMGAGTPQSSGGGKGARPVGA